MQDGLVKVAACAHGAGAAQQLVPYAREIVAQVCRRKYLVTTGHYLGWQSVGHGSLGLKFLLNHSR